MIEPSALQSDFHEHLIPNVPYAEPPDKQFMTKPRWWRSERAHEGLLPSRVPRSACPSMEPGPRFAPRLRHADYSALLGARNQIGSPSGTVCVFPGPASA